MTVQTTAMPPGRVVKLPPLKERWVRMREELGVELRRARDEKGLTHKDIADVTGIHRRTIGNLERGENTNIDNYLRYADALGLEYGWLFVQAFTILVQRERVREAGIVEEDPDRSEVAKTEERMG